MGLPIRQKTGGGGARGQQGFSISFHPYIPCRLPLPWLCSDPVYQSGLASQIPQSTEALPLAGASVLVLAGPSLTPTVVQTVEALGGTIAHAPDSCTHCLVSQGLRTADLDQSSRALLGSCVAGQLPVVEVSWLEEVATLPPGGSWEQVLLESHAAPVVAELLVSQRLDSEAISRGIGSSLSETWAYLVREAPEDAEESVLRRAIERSLLDRALTLHTARAGAAPSRDARPEAVLGVSSGASQSDIRAAYRQRALTAHPDKGGDTGTWLRLQQAYRALTGDADGCEDLAALPTRALATKQAEMREHRALVESWFKGAGVDLSRQVARQRTALTQLELEVLDVGATNRNESGTLLYNQCFYLSLACSYLRGQYTREALEETALHLKRVVEAAVLHAHPEWAGSVVGDDVQAFSDFLFFVLTTHAMLSELAFAVFDSVSGGVEVFRGKHYPMAGAAAVQAANLLTVFYVPGHYQALLSRRPDCGVTLPQLLDCLERHDVPYTVTDG